MARIRFTPRPGTMAGALTDVPTFPGDSFSLCVPEAIGDAARTAWQQQIKPEWREAADGAWQSTGAVDGELSYTATVTPGEERVDVRVALTNKSGRAWANSLAFTCFGCGSAPSLSDHECVRHWVRTGGAFKRLVEIPRRFGPRPTVQLYSVEGAPAGMSVPFVANFNATPEVAVEGWMAIRSRDDRRLTAIVSRPALFLFQNMEYSCIHSCPSFGALQPGQRGEALTRIYFVQASLEEWHARMTAEMSE